MVFIVAMALLIVVSSAEVKFSDPTLMMFKLTLGIRASSDRAVHWSRRRDRTWFRALFVPRPPDSRSHLLRDPRGNGTRPGNAGNLDGARRQTNAARQRRGAGCPHRTQFEGEFTALHQSFGDVHGIAAEPAEPNLHAVLAVRGAERDQSQVEVVVLLVLHGDDRGGRGTAPEPVRAIEPREVPVDGY